MKIKNSSTGASFGAFDGLVRTCVKFSKARGGVYRCDKYKTPGSKQGRKRVGIHPEKCGPGLISRSPGLIRVKGGCVGRRYKTYSSKHIQKTLCAQRCAGKRGKTLRKCLKKCSKRRR